MTDIMYEAKDYMGKRDFPEMYLLMSRKRDSDILEESNWKVAIDMLGGEDGENVCIYRFHHWACGWIESLCVKKGTKAFEIAENIESELADYPVLDEENYIEMEWDTAYDYWQEISIAERVRLCQHHSISIFAARRNELPETPTGELCTRENI